MLDVGSTETLHWLIEPLPFSLIGNLSSEKTVPRHGKNYRFSAPEHRSSGQVMTPKSQYYDRFS